MFFFNWNDPNKSNQDDASDASQVNDSAATQPANDYLEPAQPAQQDQPMQSMQPMQSDQPAPQQPAAPQEPTDYVDAYTPPAQDGMAAENGNVQPHLKHTPWNDDQDVQAVVDQELSNADEYYPAEGEVQSEQANQSDQSGQVAQAGMTEQTEEIDQEEADQSLESQNIFDLLGAADGEESEKEAFLDELQQVVWEDFIQSDVQTLLTEAEYAEFSQIVNQPEIANEEMQEKALEFLEKLVPDLEDILLEKALQLKQDLVWERVAGMKEYFAGQDQQLQAVVQAEALFKQGRWDDGAQLLNTLS